MTPTTLDQVELRSVPRQPDHAKAIGHGDEKSTNKFAVVDAGVVDHESDQDVWIGTKEFLKEDDEPDAVFLSGDDVVDATRPVVERAEKLFALTILIGANLLLRRLRLFGGSSGGRVKQMRSDVDLQLALLLLLRLVAEEGAQDRHVAEKRNLVHRRAVGGLD